MTSPGSLAAASVSDRSLSRLAQGMIGSEVLRIAAEVRAAQAAGKDTITTAAPPPVNGNSVCSIEASNEAEMNSADRKSLPTSKVVRSARILFARLPCSTTTPFGVPVEPEV